MENNQLFNAATGYVTGNVIANNISRDLRRISEENAEKLKYYIPEETLSSEIANFLLMGKKEDAFEYLNANFNMEIVHVAQHQKDYIYSLETMVKKRREKYAPFYNRIGMDMPEQIQTITADKLCEILGVTNLHIIDSKDGKTSPSHSKEDFDSGLILRAIIIIGLLVLMIALGAS